MQHESLLSEQIIPAQSELEKITNEINYKNEKINRT